MKKNSIVHRKRGGWPYKIKKLLYRIPGRTRAVPDGSTTMPLPEAPESTQQVQVLP